MSWAEALFGNVLCHVLFELVENMPVTHWVWREAFGSESLGEYKGEPNCGLAHWHPA